MPTRPTILLTGFGPFPGMSRNATAVLVPGLAAAARPRFDSHNIVSAVLPCEWTAAPERLAELLENARAVLALHFGVSHTAQGFDVELTSHNVRQPVHDAAGELPATACIAETGPARLATTLPAERILARLSHLGLPCRSSHDAGGYLCNTLLYHSLTVADQRGGSFLSGFVHVPANLTGHGDDGEDPHPDCPLDWDDAIAGGLEIIAASLEASAEAGTPARAHASTS